MAEGDQVVYNVAEATNPTKSIENELVSCSSGIGQVAYRQRVAVPDLEVFLSEISYKLDVIAGRTPMPDKTVEAGRQVIVSGTLTTCTTINSVSAVASVTNQVAAGGIPMGIGQIGVSNLPAAALRSKIVVS